MNTLFFENTLYRIKKEYPNLLLCQMIGAEGADIGSDGTPIKNILSSQRWKNSGTRIISKKRLNKAPKQLKLAL